LTKQKLATWDQKFSSAANCVQQRHISNSLRYKIAAATTTTTTTTSKYIHRYNNFWRLSWQTFVCLTILRVQFSLYLPRKQKKRVTALKCFAIIIFRPSVISA